MSLFQQSLPSHELPDWMRRAQRGVDWGFVLVLALCLIVSAPFALRSELPHNNADENYVYRTEDYAESIQEGWLYPRWSPNVLGGYGAPIPSFYPPAPAYAAAVLQVLLTNNPVSAVRLLYVVAFCVAGLSIYALVMRNSGANAGILAATLYVYSPYASLVVPHVQGDLTQMLVMALTPALLWATDRLIRGNQPQNLFMVTLCTGLLLLNNPQSAVIAGLLAFVYAIWQQTKMQSRGKLFQFIVAIVLGILLSGFYWIPALLEQSAVHWQQVTVGPTLTLHLSSLVEPTLAVDSAEMVHIPQLTLGLVIVGFTAAGLLIHIFLRRKPDFGVFFLTSGAILTLIGVTLLRHETWLLGFSVMCFSVNGSDVLLLKPKLSARMQRLFLPILMVGIWLGARASWLPPKAIQPFGQADGAAQIAYEQQGYGIAVLPVGDALPSTLKSNVTFNHSLIDSYQSTSINKLAPGQLTSSFQASPLAHFVHGDQFQLRLVSSPVTLSLLTAYFPGWRATIGSQRLNLQPDPDTGLIEVDVPRLNSNNSELFVVLDSTNVRLGSWLISGAVLLIVIVVTWGKFRNLRKSSLEDLELLKQDEARLIALPIACFGLVALLILIPNPFFGLPEQPRSGLYDSFSTQIRSNTGLILYGFRLKNNVYSEGDNFQITLFWQTQRFLSENYQVHIFLKNNSDSSVWGNTALHNPGYYPTRRWNTVQYVPDLYDFSLEKDIPEGNYQIHVEAYACAATCDNGTRLDFFNIDGQPLGPDIILPTLISVRH